MASSGVVSLASPSQAAEIDISGVQFRWGFNNESNNTGAAPGTVNLFSAGKIGDPGAGGQLLNSANQGATWANGAAAGWSAQSGNVRIEKKQSNDTFAKATWAGLRTTKDGVPLGNYSVNTKFSDHEVVIANGTGSLDPVTNDASIQWDGDFTVVYYSGYTFFYVSDPKLTVDNGVGTVTATVDGYAANQADLAQWEPLADTSVTLATIKNVDVTDDGLVVTPEYAGVPYIAPQGGVQQVNNGAHPGSFPQTYVDFLQQTGAGPYWYSTGGNVDKNKVALPLTVDRTPAPPVDPPVVTPPAITPPVVAPPVMPPAVVKAGTAKPVLKISKRPTSKKAGKATITVTSVGNGAKPSGKAKITITKGKSKKTLTVTIKNGKATVKLPKLKKGTWKLKASYAGSPTQRPSTSKTYKVKSSK
jgi:hypothetical protein